MLFDELLVEARARELQDAASRDWRRREAAPAHRSRGLRTCIAAALVRGGMALDRAAGERVVRTARAAR
jgi:hypothetical protein